MWMLIRPFIYGIATATVANLLLWALLVQLLLFSSTEIIKFLCFALLIVVPPFIGGFVSGRYMHSSRLSNCLLMGAAVGITLMIFNMSVIIVDIELITLVLFIAFGTVISAITAFMSSRRGKY